MQEKIKRHQRLAGEPKWFDWIKFPVVVQQLQIILLHSDAADSSLAADQRGTKDFHLKPTLAPSKSFQKTKLLLGKKKKKAI